MRVEPDRSHTECAREPRGRPPYAAEAQHTERLAVKLTTLAKRGTRPLPRTDRGCAEIRSAQQNQRGADHVLGDGQRVGAGRRDHLDPSCLACGEIDIVEPDAQPSYDAQLAGGGDKLRVDACLVAHDQRLRVDDRGEKCVAAFGERCIMDYGETPLQRRDRRLVHEFSDDDLHHERWPRIANSASPSGAPSAPRPCGR